MEGRLGHLRPKFWNTVTGIEASSPTSLFAAIKFKNFEDMLLQCGNSIVVVSFNAELCGPCRLMKKELTKVSSEIGEDIKVFSVDTDKFPKLGTRYNIAVLPTLVIFKEGIIRDRIEGMKSSNYVVDRLKALS
jgi:thioredoxin-like negative regulator of GroEL